MAAETLSGRGVDVTIYDRMPSAGRKFLMAGRGGLNLTHSEPFDDFIARYGAAAAVSAAGDRAVLAGGAARVVRRSRSADLRRLAAAACFRAR